MPRFVIFDMPMILVVSPVANPPESPKKSVIGTCFNVYIQDNVEKKPKRTGSKQTSRGRGRGLKNAEDAQRNYLALGCWRSSRAHCNQSITHYHFLSFPHEVSGIECDRCQTSGGKLSRL